MNRAEVSRINDLILEKLDQIDKIFAGRDFAADLTYQENKHRKKLWSEIKKLAEDMSEIFNGN